MAPETLSLIWQRWDNEPPLFFADEAGRHFDGSLATLVEQGLLRESTPSGSAPCWDCGRGFVGRVEYLLHRRSGTKRPFIYCSECGLKEIAPESLRRWLVDAAGCLAAISRAAGIRGPISDVMSGHLWRVGRAVWGQRAREVYFARCIHEENRDGVVAALSNHPKAILLVPTQAGAEHWHGAIVNLVVALDDVVTLDAGNVAFDASFIESQLAERDASKTKRPARKRAERTAKIEKLVEALVEHLRAARDHAYATKDRKGIAELLPRPSQQDLARLTGLTETDVSRCLKDESARELRLCWEIALDLDQIMKWRGRPRT